MVALDPSAGCDALRRGAVAALWRQLSPFEVDGYAAVLRGEAVGGRISRLASAGGSNGGEVGEAAAWVLSEVRSVRRIRVFLGVNAI